jgi:RNA polymerase sigma-70 factor (ECF subfamily)
MSKRINEMENDHELIKQFQAGKQSAYDGLVKRHLQTTYLFFLKFTKDPMDAEDLAQDVFIKLFQSLHNFRFEAAFTSYLYRIQLNAANSFIRKARWKKYLHLDQTTETGSYDQKLEQEWSKKEIWNLVATLPKMQRMVIIMRIAQDLPYKDISGILGISEGSAKVNYHHGISQLKNRFKDAK